MIVVADTSPINYLLLIGQIDLLPQLYQQVLIPQSVQRELQDAGANPSIRAWADSLPAWCTVHSVDGMPLLNPRLDQGEHDAIRLAISSSIRNVLMDEAFGRSIAESAFLEVTGTLGVLENAALKQLIQFIPCFESLLQTNFRISNSLRNKIMQRHEMNSR